ncbi:MAG: alpha-glucan family phosphorylase [Armatimonadetes bacterium]|nr:alpha-glucan family phosphorylase [Armatimonadota bacterium]
MKHPKFSRSFEVVSALPKQLEPLRKLAHNFRWTWHSETRDLIQSIDKDLWRTTGHNPIQLLAGMSEEKVEKLVKDPVFLAKLESCSKDLDNYLSAKTWFETNHKDMKDKMSIAYFCAEFGVSECLPIYSGGLGVLAGDHLKAASDLGLPLVAVGLLYNRGYFRQRLTPDGWQTEVYPQYDFYQFPIQLVRGPDQQPIRVGVEFPDRIVTCQIWLTHVGRIPLYLLDSNVLENAPHDQSITDTLYGGDEEMRIRQEMILGIGGLRALRAVGINPTVCHMNEGHAAFLSVERIRQTMTENQVDFRTARQAIVSGNVFTTHTPVPAGFDLFDKELLERYMGKMVQTIGIPFEEFLKFGRIDKDDDAEKFNMAVLAMETANHVNGVSKLHAAVTRAMFGARWPDHPENEVPIMAVTNGIHTTTWVSRRMEDLFDEYLGDAWRRAPQDPASWAKVDAIPDEELWAVREVQRGDFVRYARKHLQADMERRNMSRADFNLLGQVLDPRVLTIGFARRFATYKRATLMMRDVERLKALLFHSERPVQIVIAGKSHPRDGGGKGLIKEIMSFIADGAQGRMVFLEDYDMQLARAMVQGVDVWLNNPRRPMEASGTSGMKVVPNGGLNCSILDGWWDEGYTPEVGWAIGGREDLADEGQQDWLDSRALYALIENEISPKFYHRVDNGLPRLWINMIKASIKNLAPEFSTGRMVADYTNMSYVPAAKAYLNLTADSMAKAKHAFAWRQRIRKSWSQVRVLHVEDTADLQNRLGAEFTIKATVHIDGLEPGDVRVEAVFGQIGPNRDIVSGTLVPLQHVRADGGNHVYECKIKLCEAGYRGYTVRIVPYHDSVNVSSELNLIAWQPTV